MRKVKIDFASPPSPSSFLIWIRAVFSARVGSRDGRIGYPPPAEGRTPPHVDRRVRQANAFITGRIRRKYHRERARLADQQEKIEAEIETARAALIHELPQAPAPSAPSEEELSRRRALGAAPIAPEVPKRSKADEDARRVRRRGRVIYPLTILVLFGGETFLNKKSFEIFTATNLYLWLAVIGITVPVVIFSHYLGTEFKNRTESKHQATEIRRSPAALIPAVIITAAGGFLVLSWMRNQAVGTDRHNTILALEQQRDQARSQYSAARSRDLQLQKQKHLTPAEKNELGTLRTREATAKTAIATSTSMITSESQVPDQDKPRYAIPGFWMLNVLLFMGALVVTFVLHDPERARAADVDRDRWYDWRMRQMRHAFAMRRWRRAMKRHRRDEKRNTRRDERDRKQLLAQYKKHNTNQRKNFDGLRGRQALMAQRLATYEALESSCGAALQEMEKVYAAAAEQVQQQYRMIIGRYWTSQNRKAMKRAQRLERNWHKQNARAQERNTIAAALERPSGVPWQRPLSQDADLPFATLVADAPSHAIVVLPAQH